MKQYRILFVDDDEFIRKIYTDRLQASEFEVVAVGTAKAAKEALSSGTFDLVCLDHLLADQTGLQILKWIKEEKKLPVPVIAFSASGHEANMKDYMAAGAAEFIQKDHVMPTEFVDKIKKIIETTNHD